MEKHVYLGHDNPPKSKFRPEDLRWRTEVPWVLYTKNAVKIPIIASFFEPKCSKAQLDIGKFFWDPEVKCRKPNKHANLLKGCTAHD